MKSLHSSTDHLNFTFIRGLFSTFIGLVLLSNSALAQQIQISTSAEELQAGPNTPSFANLSEAKKHLLDLIRQQSITEATIWLSTGRHSLNETLTFTSTELADIQLTIKAKKNQKVSISGGVTIENWENIGNNQWSAPIPKSLDNPGAIRELFVNDIRAPRSRHPNSGYLRIDSSGIDRRSDFYYYPNDFPIPKSTKGVELVFLHDWSITRIPVLSIDAQSNHLTAVDSIGAKNLPFFNIDNWEKHPRYYLENSMTFLDSNHEWYIDAALEKIYIQMPQSEDPNQSEIIVPAIGPLMKLKGSKSHPIQNIEIENIVFEHSRWDIPTNGYAGIQACHFDNRATQTKNWNIVSPAVSVIWGDQCVFKQCSFERLGGSGLWLGNGSKNCAVLESNFSDISGNGIMIGEGRDRQVNGHPWWKSNPEEVALGNTVQHCTISQCGQQFYGSIGIWAGLSAETTIDQNTIFDLPYTGISVGWMWSPVETPCRANTISRNHIHHIMKTLNDGGGIYSLGLQPGSQLINNLIHDVTLNVGRAESNALFLDEGTKDVIVAGNILYSIAKSPIRFHKAEENLVFKNVVGISKDHPPIRYNNVDSTKIQKIENLYLQEMDNHDAKILQKSTKRWHRGSMLYK